jgi:hypothetical protein
MPEQTIIPRQAADLVREQAAAGLLQHMQAQAESIQAVLGIGLDSHDAAYSLLEAVLAKGGRSEEHQRHMQDRAGALLNLHDSAIDTLARITIRDIMENRYQPEQIEVSRIIEVQKPGRLSRLLGR